jgi:DNA (cytosine-5)-methyltransferase 1
MSEIAAIEPNGYSAVSTFSGAGGSSLGYKLAGFKVLWASEFIPAAQETYRANHPNTILDTRDIREVEAADILEAINMQPGELDLFDGSPPCASFSTAGRREAGWGKVKQYSDTKQRTDDLFFEYARLIKGVQPKVFVAENVSGLVKGTAKGYFIEILNALKECGYNVKAKLLDAQWLGVPQTRQRIIFIGVRNDLGLEPAHPSPLPYNYSVRDAIPWIVKHEYMGPNHTPMWADGGKPAYTVSQMGNFSKKLSDFTLVEAETDISKYAIGKLWDEIEPGEQHSQRFSLVKRELDKPCPTIDAGSNGGGDNQVRSRSGVVHPTEKRKFSIAELKRICAFPDDYILTGTYAQQWERLGRAVPPMMMYYVAKAIKTEILDRIQ